MSKKKDNNNFTRLDFSVPTHLKDKLIDYANSLGLNLTSTLIVILNEKLNS